MTESHDNPDELSKARDDLERLDPPASMEDRVTRSVVHESPRARVWQALAAAVAGFALIGTGWMLRGYVPDTPTPTTSRYVLLLFPSTTESIPDPENMEARVAEYAAWARSEGERGRVLEGHKLADSSATLNTDTETPSLLEGYFIVTASSLDEAVEIARTCPHATYGGRVEVRPIER